MKINNANIQLLVAALALVPFYIAIVYFRSRHLELQAALNGFSPFQSSLIATRPEGFADDFPSGVMDTLKSVVFLVFPLAREVGADIGVVWSTVIAVEVAVVIVTAIVAFRMLFPTAHWMAAPFAALAFAGSSINAPDLASFALPFYGWNYGYARAGALMIVAFTIRRSYVLAALALVVTFAIHPIYALFAGLFAAACFVVQLRQDQRTPVGRLAAAAAIVVIGCGAWLAWISSQGTVTGGGVDADTFIALNRAQNYHWFPFLRGIFWEAHADAFLPLIATLALIALAVSRLEAGERRVGVQVAAGVALLMLVCAVGVAASELSSSIMIIKLSLHRADSMALLVGALVVVRVLWKDVIEGDVIERSLSAWLLLLPFVADAGYAIAPVALRVFYAFLKERGGARLRPLLGVAAALAVTGVLLVLLYGVAGVSLPLSSSKYTGLHVAILGAPVVAAAWPMLLRSIGRKPAWTALAAMLLFAAGAIGAFRAERFDPLASPGARAVAQDAKQAQIWARDNTRVGSLLMVDPAFFYMGRDLSERPSFGTPREWLLVSIMYNSRQDLLEEGVRRYEALGLPFPEYVHDPDMRRMLPTLLRIHGEASERFNTMTRDGFAYLAAEYGIDYFIFQTALHPDGPPIEVVFRNAYLTIARAP